MKFSVDSTLFQSLPTACFGIVVAQGINNQAAYPAIHQALEEAVNTAGQHFQGVKVKEDARILPYREAFRALGMNPNKYLCSIEALFTRIAKGKGMPHINPIVDLTNAVSLTYTLPMGAHDLVDVGDVAIEVRPAVEADCFRPLGASEEEVPDPGEIIYTVGHQVRTRRWTWRQSDNGKIQEHTTHVFFPIDGFLDINGDQVLAARDALAQALKDHFDCQVQVGWVDAQQPVFEW